MWNVGCLLLQNEKELQFSLIQANAVLFHFFTHLLSNVLSYNFKSIYVLFSVFGITCSGLHLRWIDVREESWKICLIGKLDIMLTPTSQVIFTKSI